MSLNRRVIPRRDIKGLNVSKGVQAERVCVAGKPEMFTGHCKHDTAELRDVGGVAGVYGRDALPDIVRRTSRGTVVPVTFGRGLGHAAWGEGDRS